MNSVIGFVWDFSCLCAKCIVWQGGFEVKTLHRSAETDLFFKKPDGCAHFLVLLNEIFCDAKDEIGQSPMKFQMQAFEMKSNPLVN